MSSDDAIKLGDALLKRGVLTAERLRDALVEHAKEPGGTFDALLLARGWATQAQIDAAKEPLAVFGKYDLIRELGRGGMGVVYEARDRELGRHVALKLMLGRPERPAAPSEEERFVREARLAAALPPHPNIVGVFDAGAVDGRRFIAMELVQGVSFGVWRKKAPLRAQVEVLRDVARALHHAHKHGVIHRDLKPDNILIDERQSPHITDFGLAKGLGEDAGVSLTAEGMVVGTPAYMSPEQARGSKSIDGRADVWALGVLLYETLTGRPPFQGNTAVEILMKASQNAVPSPSRIVPREAMASYDAALEKVCLKALAKKAVERYSSADSFANELDRWLRGEEVKARPSTVQLKMKSGGGSKILPLALGLAAALGLGFAALVYVQAPARPEPRPPEKPPEKKPLSLLAKADPADALRGAWRLQNGELVSDSDGLAIFYLPGEPPAEYDLRVEFTPRGALPDINVVAVVNGQPFQWYVGAQNSSWYGFGRIDGDPAFGHPSGTRQPALLGPGRRHVALLEVRKERITGYVDGRKLASLELKGRTLGMTPDMLSPKGARLGLTTYNNPSVFHAVELRPK